ncbi:unnamed protein product [Polarella glacialis]|uniref:Uncharacterized protein n=1 Tax=Polarella glacialis TaxID=89957 RepID=A0A813DLP8_POLGL|nr:unnamed protein product [Polarella glacialis]CAE8613530.1 unnamed protein product [Polarella glacialis]CAE8668517.1 unnamed protein product [Polarella glacialis]|mmetsp:Transcript_67102/g.108033  ORF Transcript_67102/g.108033 Transcript_67102/m.108033 type:complete len:218 (-) Transcript_67102:315-968(-)
MAECTVLPGLFGICIQGLLFVIVCGVLVFKKTREPERSWRDWGLDSSKQIMGSGWIHILNLFCSTKLDAILPQGDQCEWYWIQIMVDTTLGVLVEYAVLSLLLRLLEGIIENGHYFDEVEGKLQFSFKKYTEQMVLWLFVVTVMKFGMVFLMYAAATPLEAVAGYVLKPFMDNARSKLVVVMILTPMCMNAVQFWIVDNFLKAHKDYDHLAEDSALS